MQHWAISEYKKLWDSGSAVLCCYQTGLRGRGQGEEQNTDVDLDLLLRRLASLVVSRQNKYIYI